MARPLRIEYPGAWYHVMNRGLGRTKIFFVDKDRQAFLEILKEISEIFRIEIHAYSLPDNHYHLLVHTPEAGLSRAMRHLNGLYTQSFNRRHKTDGPLFRGRYKALVVESDEYLLELVRYIHLNPLKAGLCREIADHPWTSHRAYLQVRERPPWLVTDEVLGRFGSKENEAKKELDRFVREGVPERFEKTLKRERVVLGTEGFKEWVYQNFLNEKREEREIPRKDRKLRRRVSPKAILHTVALAYDVRVSDLRRSRRGEENEARATAGYLLRHLTGLSQKEIALWIRCPSAYTVATIQKRLRTRMERRKKLRKKIAELSCVLLNQVKT